MTILEAIALGIVQGLTEFLPVSSSGHLVIAKSLLGVETQGASFEVFVHLGTLAAVLLHFRRDVLAMAGSVLRLRRDSNSRLFLLVLLASIPAAVIGIMFEERISAAFANPALAAAMLIVTGVVLLLTRIAPLRRNDVRPPSALAIGAAQAVAILPGISRSGSTIAAGIFAGVDRTLAARFSFLMLIPVLAGAALLTLLEAPLDARYATACTAGALTAFASGYLALRWLLAAVAPGRFDRFGWYCLAVGVCALVYFAVR